MFMQNYAKNNQNIYNFILMLIIVIPFRINYTQLNTDSSISIEKIENQFKHNFNYDNKLKKFLSMDNQRFENFLFKDISSRQLGFIDNLIPRSPLKGQQNEKQYKISYQQRLENPKGIKNEEEPKYIKEKIGLNLEIFQPKNIKLNEFKLQPAVFNIQASAIANIDNINIDKINNLQDQNDVIFINVILLKPCPHKLCPTIDDALTDVRDAFMYILDNHLEIKIDPFKLIISGNSIGGLLAMILATENFRLVKQVQSRSGLQNLEAQDIKCVGLFNYIRNKGMDNEDPCKFQEKYSIINQIQYQIKHFLDDNSILSNEFPYYISLHGTRDQIVNINQAQEFHNTLERLQINQLLLTVEDDHLCDNSSANKCSRLYEYALEGLVKKISQYSNVIDEFDLDLQIQMMKSYQDETKSNSNQSESDDHFNYQQHIQHTLKETIYEKANRMKIKREINHDQSDLDKE